ncbi:SRPBCC family protein [Melittangium boletus]|uniref:SRPBCC family protein n=1 Tax=Melittangium boletus TaxID=83453 RepID=UPI003DA2B5CB
MKTPTPPYPADRTLSVTRLIDAPREVVFKAWFAHLQEWWAPAGFTTPRCDVEPQVGGIFRTVMRDGGGNEYPNQGVFLEVRASERIVFTDAFLPGWIPSEKAFLTGVFTFEDEGGKTRYTARALHWNAEDRASHEKMGFHEGWGMVADQFAAVVARVHR